MDRVMEVLRSRQLRELLIVVLVAVLIWVAGPYVAVAGHVPLESAVGRLIAILLVVVAWALLAQLRVVRGDRASSAIASGVAEQASDSRAQSELGADSVQIRRRFEEAMATLRKTKKSGLYDLPWYVIIGPPGAGKTTVLSNSGLDFPLASEFGREGLRGVGGTRNCDWWFTDEAVLIDTAGRFTTQDSDAAADRDGWLSFLRLLKKNRPRRPINGVMVALSIADLLTLSDDQLAGQVKAVRSRLREITSELEINFPVYLLLTKSDLITGFSEFFDDLDREGRAQVLGFTLDLAQSRKGAGRALIDENIDELVRNLSGRVLPRLESDRDAYRRALIFGFCEQIAGLKNRISDTAEKILAEDSTGPRRAWLRGVYFTSGTQEGTPIDRMLGALAQAFSLDVSEEARTARGGRAYFIERLLREVVLREAALAGLDSRAAFRARAFQSSGYVAAGVTLVAAAALLTASYQANSRFLSTVEKAMGVLDQAPSTGAGLEVALARLDAIAFVRDAIARTAESGSWLMGLGLSMESTVADSARDAYGMQARSSVVPVVERRLEDRLSSLGADPDRLYEYLRAYLMLAEPDRIQPQSLTEVVRAAFSDGADATATGSQQIVRHFEMLLRDPDGIGSISADAGLVDSARGSLRNASPARIGYQRYRLTFPTNDENAVRLDRELGLGSDRVFVRASGRSLSDPEPAVFTRKAFDEFRTTGSMTLIQAFLEDRWVLGPEAPNVSDSARLLSDVIALYEEDYIRHWDGILSDLSVISPTNDESSAELFRLMGSPSSPFRALLVLVDRETNFAKPQSDPAAAAAGDAATKAAGSIFGAPTGPPPGEAITRHFRSAHDLVAGSPAPIDGLLARLRAVSDVMGKEGAGVEEAIKILKGEAKLLPPPFDSMVSSAATTTEQRVDSEARTDLANQYRESVVRACQTFLSGKYPFSRGGEDVPLADVGQVLARGGVFDRFYSEHLSSRVDRVGETYRWRSEDDPGVGAVDLGRFSSAERARGILFANDSATPSFGFYLSAETLDEDVTRMLFEMDGQSLEYRHGPVVTKTLRWPGDGAGRVDVSFEMKDGSRRNRSFNGPWSLFRFLDDATVERLGGVRFRVRFPLEGAEVAFVLEAQSSKSPINDESWRTFKCQ